METNILSSEKKYNSLLHISFMAVIMKKLQQNNILSDTKAGQVSKALLGRKPIQVTCLPPDLALMDAQSIP